MSPATSDDARPHSGRPASEGTPTARLRHDADSPATAVESMDSVFHALAHPVRRRILDILRRHPGASVGEVCAHFEISRIAVMKHLKTLELSSLVLSKKEGRTRVLHFNLVPIQMIYDRWTSEYSSLWARRLTDLKYRVEARAAGAGAADRPPSDDQESTR